MAGVQQGEKLLFEKFWRGTFKAVASPRPESIIVTSITACRRPVTHSEPSTCQVDNAVEKKGRPADVEADAVEKNGHVKGRETKHRGHRRVRSLSFDNDLSPRPAPKGKKKRKKSQRKRRRKRSPSYSISPVRKKKKKKSSKKRKRHRSDSKKRRHSSSSLKSKRKDDKKHKKRSRSRLHRRRQRPHKSDSESSACRSSSPDGRRLHRSRSGSPARQPGHKGKDRTSTQQMVLKLGPLATPACNTPPMYRPAPSDGTIVHSGSAVGVFTQKGIGRNVLSTQNKGQQDYDSGNDTSSPPSTKTCLSRSKVSEDKSGLCEIGSRSPEKSRFTGGDNSSDSGHSVTSYSSSCKPLPLDSGTTFINGSSRGMLTPAVCGGGCGRPKASRVTPGQSVTPPRRRSETRSRSSRSRSRSSRSSRFSSRYSRSRSPSSERRSYSRTPSSSGRSRQSSVESGSFRRSPSYTRYSPRRAQGSQRGHKRSKRERRRKRSYSPMRKRRRDSPSHLEARRITSARKRPIPYYRPSPSSSSRSTSYSSWSSIFTRSRSRSTSRSCSTYRSYSRSPSWSSISVRSSSYDSVGVYSRARR
ncbi:serine/arginine repetitive matrix protein 4 [Paramormyrops kingsleyae]|uniref:Serine/arginine repetitive matrix 4 n=1 Tax=Paramormyrops kingsleyae TaxID=1676925 RepID=A0A3B3SAI2_9TELE|nr:serine/arginine repetitive matrix protein 4 [Paramormyrops kingsleyae]